MKKLDEEKQVKGKRKNLEFPVRLQFFNYNNPRKEIITDAVLITGDEKYGNYFYLVLSVDDTLKDLFDICDDVFAFYEHSATFKYIKKKVNCGKYVSFKFEIVYNKFKKRG